MQTIAASAHSAARLDRETLGMPDLSTPFWLAVGGLISGLVALILQRNRNRDDKQAAFTNSVIQDNTDLRGRIEKLEDTVRALSEQQSQTNITLARVVAVNQTLAAIIKRAIATGGRIVASPELLALLDLEALLKAGPTQPLPTVAPTDAVALPEAPAPPTHRRRRRKKSASALVAATATSTTESTPTAD
jgi:hypothetical protein